MDLIFKKLTLFTLCSTLLGCGGSSDTPTPNDNNVDEIVSTPSPAPNSLPVIEQVAHLVVKERDRYVIDATAYDPDGQIVSYQWKWTEQGTNYFYSGSNELHMMAPAVDTATPINYTLTVTDEQGAQAEMSGTVLVEAYPEFDAEQIKDSRLLDCLNDNAADTGTYRILCSSPAIKDLSGLSQFSQLQELAIRNAEIQSLAPLSALPNLERLFLIDAFNSYTGATENVLNDINQLASLKELYVDSRYGEVLQGLSIDKLQELESITLSGSTMVDFDASQLISNSLQSITIDGLNVYNLDKLGLIASLKELKLENIWQIENLNFLSSLENLERLHLYSARITDASALTQLEHLKSLELISSELKDTDILYELNNLESLQYNLSSDDFKVFDLARMTQFTNLHTLSLSNLDVINKDKLSQFSKLKNLRLHNNDHAQEAFSTSHLNGLNDLESVSLYANNLSELDALSAHSKLKTLELSDISENTQPDYTQFKLLESLDLKFSAESSFNGDLVSLRESSQLSYLTISAKAFINGGFEGSDSVRSLSLFLSDTVELPQLSMFANLRSLNLSLGDSSNVSLNSLGKHDRLSELRLSGSALDNMEFAKSLTQLRALDFTGKNMTDISAIKSLRNLRSLNLNQIEADFNAEVILEMPFLRVLVINDSALSCDTTKQLQQFAQENDIDFSISGQACTDL
ncbi:leucine-rich repeat domain-containing protein [Pseudoalteromonas sp. T1lg23B]|uniref:leucine-rich repeat domain-containing protein n=1 Tax=Pseudoalteromonas sp. T1lg23B TaxID=2077097 RepID=UPI000CF5FAE9|nr:hypothetical protein [Pseudoalteromonas sp. T1lg23B]